MTTPETPSTDVGTAAERIVYVVQRPELPRDYDEGDLGRFIGVLWSRRWWVATFTSVVTLASVAYAVLAVPYYRAEAVLLPREGRANYGLTSQLSQFAGLADLAGINVGSTGKQEPLGVLRSKGFARRFIEENELLGVLAVETSFRIVGDTDVADAEPDMRRVVDDFTRSIMSVSEDKKSGLVTVAVIWRDPNLAAVWANKLVNQVNYEMRLRALNESESNIRHLTEQLRVTDLVSVQQSISRVLEAEIQKLTLAKGTGEYAFRLIDTAVPPVRRHEPKRVLIVTITFIIALAFSAFVALLVDPVRRVLAAARGT
jgi:uncharacterized protein involved in exopolysaccharide biosynthesis